MILISKRVRHGDNFLSKLLTTCLEEELWKLDWEKAGLRINVECISKLILFENNTVLFSESGEQLQKLLQDVRSDSVVIGLEIRIDKSKNNAKQTCREHPLQTK